MHRIYAIGDIHGQLDMLRAAHARIAADRQACGDPDAVVVHLGDLCDRGPNSAGVIQFLIDGIARGEPWRVIKGNHDKLFLDFLQSASLHDGNFRAELTWLHTMLGGADTLASYGIQDAKHRPLEDLHAAAGAMVPPSHRDFLAGLPLFLETDDLILVHAGIRPGVPMSEQVEDDLVWIRYDFLDDTRDHGKLVVHGHTPVDAPMHFGNRVALDTGAGFFNPLTAAVFEGRDCWVLTDTGRVPLPPPA